MEIWGIVLGSSVLSAIVGSALGYFQNQKNNQICSITVERKRWREEIRKIVDELQESNEGNVDKILTKLKVRINPLGYNKRGYIDYYVWSLIEKLQNGDIDNFAKTKDSLIHVISIMLKEDWEKSKSEVNFNLYKFFRLSFAVLQIVSFILLNVLYGISPEKVILLIILSFCLYGRKTVININKEFFETKPVGKELIEKKEAKKRLLGVLWPFILVLGLVSYCIFMEGNLSSIIKQSSYKLVDAICVAFIHLIFFAFLGLMDILTFSLKKEKQLKILEAVNEILEKFED